MKEIIEQIKHQSKGLWAGDGDGEWYRFEDLEWAIKSGLRYIFWKDGDTIICHKC